MTHYRRLRPRTAHAVPQWDLSLVLRTLKKSPFEPIRTSDLKWLTWKTAFLLLLAMGGRRGELQAIDSSTIRIVGNWDSVVLNPKPEFVAKNQDSSSGARRLRDIVIDSLSDLTGKRY